jgi:hypothetical protein
MLATFEKKTKAMKVLRLQSLFVFIALVAMNTSCDENADESIAAAPKESSSSIGKIKGSAPSARVAGDMFDGTEGDPIPFPTAEEWILNYQEKHPEATRAHFFGNEIISQILAENGAIGIRIYYAINDDGEPQLILLGAGADGNDLIPGQELQGGSNHAADISYPCPPYCPK